MSKQLWFTLRYNLTDRKFKGIKEVFIVTVNSC